MEMNRRMFLCSLSAGFAAQAKPNIVLLIPDDLGFSGISVQGESMAFTTRTVTSPVPSAAPPAPA